MLLRILAAGSQPTHRRRCHARQVTQSRLLLVDDEDNLRSMLEAALRHSGFEVHPVADGRERARGACPRCGPT